MVSTGQRAVSSNGVVLAFDAGVLADQQLLQRGGYYKGVPNGYTDAAHDAAVRAARAVYGFPPGTVVDAPLRAKLQQITVLAPDPVFPREGPRIQEAQQALRDIGVYNGPAMGVPNADFDAALRTYQIRERLPSYPGSATPILDDQTLMRLQVSAAAARSRGEAPLPPLPNTPPPVQQPGSPPPMPPVGLPPVGLPSPVPPIAAAPVRAGNASASMAGPVGVVLGAIALATWGSYLLTRIR